MADINCGPAWLDDAVIPPRTISGLTAERDAFMEDNAALFAALVSVRDRLLEEDARSECGCVDAAACPLCLAYEEIEKVIAAHYERFPA